MYTTIKSLNLYYIFPKPNAQPAPNQPEPAYYCIAPTIRSRHASQGLSVNGFSAMSQGRRGSWTER